MRIVHRIGISSSPQVRAELADLGVDVESSGFVDFEIDEQHPQWSAIQSWVVRQGASDFISTIFSNGEVSAARWLELIPDWHHGYPQPDEGSFGYLSATYDLTGYCQACGIGARQVAPFQMKGEPKWGRRGIMQLNWVFDEFFATPQVWATQFKSLGVGRLPVLTPKEHVLETVVQLVINVEADVVVDGLDVETCPTCGRTRYLPVTRGPFPALVSEPTGAVAKTRQWFGSGRSSHRRVLVDQGVRRALGAAKVRGASFRPVATAPTMRETGGQQ